MPYSNRIARTGFPTERLEEGNRPSLTFGDSPRENKKRPTHRQMGTYSDRLGRKGLPEETLEKAISHKLILGDFLQTQQTRIDLLTSRDHTTTDLTEEACQLKASIRQSPISYFWATVVEEDKQRSTYSQAGGLQRQSWQERLARRNLGEGSLP